MIETQKNNKNKRERKPFRKGRKNRGPDDFQQKLIDLRRVARVVAGGRRFSFRAAVVAGDMKGKVGFGLGKGTDTATSIQKAFREAKKNMITVPITQKGTIAHDVHIKYLTSEIIIKPTQEGHGLVAGSSVRQVLYHAGVKNASAKIISKTKNKVSNARAAIEALKKLKKE